MAEQEQAEVEIKKRKYPDETETDKIKLTGKDFELNSDNTLSIDISKSKHISILTNTSFPFLIRSKLQLDSHEHLSATISGNQIIFSASKKDILELVEKEVVSVRETGQFRSLKPVNPVIIENIPIGFDPLPAHVSFLRGKLLGPNGSFLKHIQITTRTRVQLRGKGSGYFEVGEPKSGALEEQEAMHMRVEGHEISNVKEAKSLCEDLIATARSEYEAKIFPRPSPQFYPPLAYSNYNAYYAPQTPEQYYAIQQAYSQYYAAQMAAYAKTEKGNNEKKDLEKK